jgi:hypothetical protein
MASSGTVLAEVNALTNEIDRAQCRRSVGRHLCRRDDCRAASAWDSPGYGAGRAAQVPLATNLGQRISPGGADQSLPQFFRRRRVLRFLEIN